MTELLVRILCSVIASVYFIQRFRKYVDGRKNNNVTGDVLFRWESVSLIDKYHIRERFFGGSRLRIKRDAKRREIKYYVITFIPALALIYSSFKVDDLYTFVLAILSLIFVITLLFDRVEYKGNYLKIVLEFCGMILSLLGFLIMSGHVLAIKELGHIFSKFIIQGKSLGIQIDMYIPFAVIMLVTIYSLIKKRILSLMICVLSIVITYLSVGISGFPSTANYLLIYFIGYLYVSLFAMQCIYNIRALKKITFIN